MKEDRIISALIGLTGACSTNPKTDNTDNIIIKALAFPLICPEYDDRELQEITSIQKRILWLPAVLYAKLHAEIHQIMI